MVERVGLLPQDKHLSYRFDLAKQMVDTSKELGFPFLAGSSIPCGWRMPALDMPHGAKVVEALAYAASSPPSSCWSQTARGVEGSEAARPVHKADSAVRMHTFR